MEELDFSVLTDDQLFGLIRAALREVATRDPLLSEAAKSTILDEAERAKIAAEATDREAAKMRAVERARLAEEAAERIRQARAAQEREVAKARGEAARQREMDRERNRIGWLRRAAALVDMPPADITLLLVDTRYGRRVLLNQGSNRYTHDHLVDFTVHDNSISTKQGLVRRKADLAALCAELAATYPTGGVEWVGADRNWSLAE